MALGSRAKRPADTTLLTAANKLASALPDLVMTAKRRADAQFFGWRDRFKRGYGENFWQFRPYVPGHSLADIDWRRSAREDHLFIRDREAQMAQSFWIWADQGASMGFQSRFANESKIERAMLLALCMADLLSRLDEFVGVPLLLSPTRLRGDLAKIAPALCDHSQRLSEVDFSDVPKYSELLIFSDFLESEDAIMRQFAFLAERNVIAHIIAIADPVEVNFPYRGNIQFEDPKSGKTVNIRQAESLKLAYQELYFTRRQALEACCKNHCWSFTSDITNAPIHSTLQTLSANFSTPSRFFRGI